MIVSFNYVALFWKLKLSTLFSKKETFNNIPQKPQAELYHHFPCRPATFIILRCMTHKVIYSFLISVSPQNKSFNHKLVATTKSNISFEKPVKKFSHSDNNHNRKRNHIWLLETFSIFLKGSMSRRRRGRIAFMRHFTKTFSAPL